MCLRLFSIGLIVLETRVILIVSIGDPSYYYYWRRVIVENGLKFRRELILDARVSL